MPVSPGIALPRFKSLLLHLLALSPVTSQCLSILIYEGGNQSSPHRAAVWIPCVCALSGHSDATYHLSNPELPFILNLEFKLVPVQILYREGFSFRVFVFFPSV